MNSGEISEDDPKSLHLIFQAVSLSIQLSQSNDIIDPQLNLINPLLEREQEMLQSLVKLSVNTPYTKESLKRYLQSNGLYVLAVCFNPGMLHYNTTILDVGKYLFNIFNIYFLDSVQS